VVVSIAAGPMFLSHETMRTSVRLARAAMARVWIGSRLVVRL